MPLFLKNDPKDRFQCFIYYWYNEENDYLAVYSILYPPGHNIHYLSIEYLDNQLKIMIYDDFDGPKKD